ncbi:MAG: FAD-dependent tricarballylate dehydrogenase TcuA [Chloroflexi bacterium]|nr:FAD-dependent tricarballylate dehydrogenase TcuA [Chloroflexota bacterium]
MATKVHRDVVVVGAGHAAHAAAVAAAQQGARVTVLEKAPEHARGGTGNFTGGRMRFPFETVEDLRPLVRDFSPDEEKQMQAWLARPGRKNTQAKLYDDFMRICEGRSDPNLVQVLVTQGFPTALWMAQTGFTWVPTLNNPLHIQPVQIVGGGWGMLAKWYELAEAMGVEHRYDTPAVSLLQDARGRVSGVRALTPEGYRDFTSGAVVLACGGYEANAEKRAAYLGPGWEQVPVRAVPYNTGDGHRMAFEVGAMPCGQWTFCHNVLVDIASPPFGRQSKVAGSQELDRSYLSLGILVNIRGERFVDEGDGFFNDNVTKVGPQVVRQPRGVAFEIFDAKVTPVIQQWRPVRGIEADTLEELADRLGIEDRQGFIRTVQRFNAAVQGGNFDPFILDGLATRGLPLPKTNWALPLDTPPYFGLAVTTGVTFSFGGLRIDQQAQVQDTRERSIPGLYACGTIVGGIFYNNYPGHCGLLSGATFGKIAGTHAAEEASVRRGAG